MSSLADSGPRSLRAALAAEGPAVITFDVDGDIALRAPLRVRGGTTIDGRGRNVTLVGKGLQLRNGGDIAITHLGIRDVLPDSEDGVQIGAEWAVPVRGVLLDCLRLRQSTGVRGDEALSVVWGSGDVTLRRSVISGWEKTMLFGLDEPPSALEANVSVSLHDNEFRGNARRQPRARHGRFDIYNNAFLDWRPFYRFGSASVNRSFGILCENGCRMRVEHNLFGREATAFDRFPPSWARQATRCRPAWFNWHSRPGRIYAAGNRVLDGSAPVRFGVGCDDDVASEPAFERTYPITPWPATRR